MYKTDNNIKQRVKSDNYHKVGRAITIWVVKEKFTIKYAT